MAVNWGWNHRIDQTCGLSPCDEEISPFWFIYPRLLVTANNLHVSENFSDAPHQNSSNLICTLWLFIQKIPLKEVFYLT